MTNRNNQSNYYNTDFKTGIDWNTIGDYSGLSGKPYDSGSTWSGNDKWKDALSKGLNWLASSDKNKYRSQGERQPSVNFAKNTSGSGFQQIAPDISVFMPQQQAPFTVAGGQPSGGGLGSTIGGLVGIGGTALGVFGPLGPAAGAAVGGLIDRF